MTPDPALNPYAPPKSSAASAASPAKVKRPASVKTTIVLFAFAALIFGWVSGSIVANQGWHALIAASMSQPWSAVAPLLRVLALFILIFGGRSRIAYWTGTATWSAILLELAFTIRVRQAGPEVLIVLAIVLLFVWLAWAFIFGKPSRAYFRMTSGDRTALHPPADIAL